MRSFGEGRISMCLLSQETGSKLLKTTKTFFTKVGKYPKGRIIRKEGEKEVREGI
jgi:hypothetical protein